MQIMPKTASFVCSIYGVEEKSLLEANFNILVGTLYIKYLLQKFGSERLAILAYNAGEGRVISWIESGQIDNVPYRETKSYCKKIFARKRAYKAIIEF